MLSPLFLRSSSFSEFRTRNALLSRLRLEGKRRCDFFALALSLSLGCRLARSHSVLNGEEGLVRTREEEETWINWKAASLLFPSGPFSKTLCAQGGRLAKVGGVGRYEQHTRSHRERYGGRRRRERMCPLPLCGCGGRVPGLTESGGRRKQAS